MISRITLVFATIVSLTACDPLSFGDDVSLTGPEFDQPTLDRLATTTHLTFPAGSVGVNYFFMGSGIDDALVAEIVIPSTELAGFLDQERLKSGDVTTTPSTLGNGHSWWTPATLTDATHITCELPNAQSLTVSAGKSGTRTVVFVAWFST